MSKRYMEDHERDGMIDAIRCNREEPTQFTPPDKDQKWRARELFGFMWRHLKIGISPGYRDVMLFLIEKSNADSGQINWRQSKIAKQMLLSRDYINQACRWWASETPYLRTERRKGADGWFVSNAYHIQWDAIEAAWFGVQESIHADSVSTTVTDSMSATDADSVSTTRNSKENGKGEWHQELVQRPSDAVTTPPFENKSSMKSQSDSVQAESSEKRFSVKPMEEAKPHHDPAVAVRLNRDLSKTPELFELVSAEIEDAALVAEAERPGAGIELIRREMAK